MGKTLNRKALTHYDDADSAYDRFTDARLRRIGRRQGDTERQPRPMARPTPAVALRGR